MPKLLYDCGNRYLVSPVRTCVGGVMLKRKKEDSKVAESSKNMLTWHNAKQFSWP